MPALQQIQIINRTSKIRDERWRYALPCWQHQMSKNFAPKWGVDYELRLVGRAEVPDARAWKLWLLDRGGLSGALGFHSVADDGQPYGKVGVLDDVEEGVE